jgi:hypothetical protein
MKFAQLLFLTVFVCLAIPAVHAELKTENVILVTVDGLRWQEVFGGMDERLVNRDEGHVPNVRSFKERYDAETAKARREIVMPFFWNVIAKDGQVWGDPDSKTKVYVENTQIFSYPGYNEILTGRPDSEIKSNAKKNNENVTVLEWVNQQPDFKGRVEAFCSWDVFPFIINEERSGVPVNAGWEKFDNMGDKKLEAMLNAMTDELPHYWEGVRFDHLTYEGAIDSMRHHKPRLLYVGLGETDDWAHDSRYDMYLDSAVRTDGYIKGLWDFAQSQPQYAGKTSLVIVTDHGRGDTHPGWKSHGKDIEGAEKIWFAVMGPDTPAKGVVKKGTVTQGQTAATVAALLGLDFAATNGDIREAVKGAIGK